MNLAHDQLIDGKYRLGSEIGRGAWATVHEGFDIRLRRRVAIKFLNANLVDNAELRPRFVREAEAATKISSPYVVAVHDVGEIERHPYIVMEFLEGEDLAQRLDRLGTLSESDVVRIGLQVLSGLADAHANGILHRDIKPENLFIVRNSRGEEIVKIVDFGISRFEAEVRPERTSAEMVLGSPAYMSPEQCRGTREMDQRSDLYSLGVVLFESITGHVPHVAEGFNELLFKIALEDAPSSRSLMPAIETELADVLDKALRREPADRYQSALDFRDALLAWSSGRGETPSMDPYSTARFRIRGEVPASGSSSPPYGNEAAVLTARPALADPTLATLRDGGAEDAPLGTSPRRRKLGVLAVLGGAALALAAVVFLMRLRGETAAPHAGPAPERTEVAPSTAPLPPAPAASTAAAEPAPVASEPARVHLGGTGNAPPRASDGLAGKPRAARAQTSASVPAPTPSAPFSAPPVTSGKSVIEGRAVQTTF